MITLKARAKINIGLKICGKRKDGYHDIETTLTTVNLSDLIQMEEIKKGIVVECKDLDIPAEDNLCYKAAKLFNLRYNNKKGIRIQIIKNIPIGGGLGGGSSDAAAVLKGMSKIFGYDLETQELTELGEEIGCDVPFFIKGGAAYATGKGDQLKYFTLPKMSFLIYYPGYQISTKWAYSEYDKMIEAEKEEIAEIKQHFNKNNKKNKFVDFKIENHFEKVVFKKHPDLLDIKMNLLAVGGFFVSLSGSGSCLYVMIDGNNRRKLIKYIENIGAEFYEVKTV